MANFTAVLKSEIARVARKSVKAELEALRRSTAAQRTEILALKRRLEAAEKSLRQLEKLRGPSQPSRPSSVPSEQPKLRFRAAGLASNRRRLGLSVAELALLVGATPQSVYGWEQGKTTPRGPALSAIAELRGVGKKEVAKRLEALRAAA